MATPALSHTWSESTTVGTYVNATDRPLESFPLYIASQYLWMVCPPFIFLFGIFGNVMTISIMRRATGDESVIHIYFSATALFDTIKLCCMLGEWMRFTFNFNVAATHSVVCKIYIWLLAGGGVISAWCLVCMTVHRAMSVVWPHRVNVLCTRRTVLLVLTAVTVFLAALYSQYMIGMERVFVPSTNTYLCTVGYNNQSYMYFFQNFVVYIELAAYCLFPCFLLILSNSVLIWKLSASVKSANRMLTQGESDKVQSREKAANSVTLTVIVVSLTLIVLTLPVTIDITLNYLTLNHNRLSDYELSNTRFISAVCYLLSYTNNAVNFYLYCLTGRRFREEFLKVMCCGKN